MSLTQYLNGNPPLQKKWMTYANVQENMNECYKERLGKFHASEKNIKD